eukprot:NODE_26807_length_537_cov_1.682927.p1 GENE.NODE_26807_length_537_cov_1.682927~~NODE_26807_length_537_cov_1.682927.p1  ORF type:complete len:144 (-),score=15.50 NODE_26807_length_537_cov_1.682927:8-439(-)
MAPAPARRWYMACVRVPKRCNVSVLQPPACRVAHGKLHDRGTRRAGALLVLDHFCPQCAAAHGDPGTRQSTRQVVHGERCAAANGKHRGRATHQSTRQVHCECFDASVSAASVGESSTGCTCTPNTTAHGKFRKHGTRQSGAR